MKHYLAVLVPADHGGWRAHLPDFPGCRAEGATVEAAVDASAAAATRQAQDLRIQGVSLPTPQTYEDVRNRTQWAVERRIDWSRAVASLVKVST
jgi:predicted RNase H-like HicB family nuclease